MIASIGSAEIVESELNALLGLDDMGTGQATGFGPSAFAFDSARSASREEVSVAGVMLLSAMSVGMAIMGMLTLALVVIGSWWLISHIPVPPVVMHLLARMGLATG